MKTLIPALVILATITACTEPPISRDGREIKERSAIWEAAMGEGDIDTVVGLYADDARMMPPGAEMTVGLDPIRESFGEMAAAGLRLDLSTLEARIAGDIGYHVGTYRMDAPDGSTLETGKFIETWRLHDGEWVITSDIWNSDAADEHEEPAPHETLTFIHEVEDPARWLAAWEGEDGRRRQFLENGAMHVHVFQNPDNPKLTGLVVAVADMEAFQAFMASPAAAAAKAEDGVIDATLQVFGEVR